MYAKGCLERSGTALGPSGKRAAFVLVHGLATNLAFWYFSVLPLLGSDYTVTLYDLRGHGLAIAPVGKHAADMAQDLVTLLDHVGIRRAHIIGTAVRWRCISPYCTRIAFSP